MTKAKAKREVKYFEMPCFVRPPMIKAQYRFYDHDDGGDGWPLYELVLSQHKRRGWEITWYRFDNRSYYKSRLRGPLAFHMSHAQLQGRRYLKFKRQYAMDVWMAHQYGPEFAIRQARTKEGRDTLIARFPEAAHANWIIHRDAEIRSLA